MKLIALRVITKYRKHSFNWWKEEFKPFHIVVVSEDCAMKCTCGTGALCEHIKAASNAGN
jgi:hypothetical protein